MHSIQTPRYGSNSGEIEFTSLSVGLETSHQKEHPMPNVELAARHLVDHIAIIKNLTVYALGGNANRPSLQEEIRAIKGDARGNAPVAWTVPFDHPRSLGVFKTNHLDELDKYSGLMSVRKLLENPEAMTDRFGGVAFMRGPANLEIKRSRAIPDSIIPTLDAEGSLIVEPTVQQYSPAGNYGAEQLIGAMVDFGAEPVMTSANFSGQPEIVDEDEMIRFKQQTGLSIVPVRSEVEKPRFKASYPIFEYSDKGFKFVRSGFIDKRILVKLMAGLPLAPDYDHDVIESSYPDNTLRMEHLPAAAQNAKGAEMRKYILQAILS